MVADPIQRGADDLAMARSLLRERRARDAFFAPGLFGEPAWDLLLTLYIAHGPTDTLSLVDACTEAGISPEAGSFAFAKLEQGGMVEVQRRRHDRVRPTQVRLSQDGFKRMAAMLLGKSRQALN